MSDLDALLRRLDELDQEQALMRHRLEELDKERVKAQQDRDHYRQLYQEMLERCRKLEKGLLGQKSERLRDDGMQLSLGVLELVLGERARAEIDDLAEQQVVKEHKRAKPTGRKPIPEHLPRVEVLSAHQN